MLVAVYGTLKQGHGNHAHFINKQPVACDQLPGFKMFSLGGFPAVQPSDSPEDQIVVEIYDVTEEQLCRLDGLEGVPSLYQRVQLDTIHGKVFMYTMDRVPVNAPRVDGGVW